MRRSGRIASAISKGSTLGDLVEEANVDERERHRVGADGPFLVDLDAFQADR